LSKGRINNTPETVLNRILKLSICIEGDVKKNKRCCVYTATGSATIDTAEAKGNKLNFSGNILGDV
jgi:hypothetical protein